MFALLNPTVWLVALALMAGSYGMGRWQQYQSDEKAQVAEVLKLTEKARQVEQNWQSDAHEAEVIHAQELRSIAAKRDAAVASLRNRPERLSDAARPACAGATGAELSGRDGDFLSRLATRADRLRADLETCKSWIQTVTKAKP